MRPKLSIKPPRSTTLDHPPSSCIFSLKGKFPTPYPVALAHNNGEEQIQKSKEPTRRNQQGSNRLRPVWVSLPLRLMGLCKEKSMVIFLVKSTFDHGACKVWGRRMSPGTSPLPSCVLLPTAVPQRRFRDTPLHLRLILSREVARLGVSPEDFCSDYFSRSLRGQYSLEETTSYGEILRLVFSGTCGKNSVQNPDDLMLRTPTFCARENLQRHM